MRGTQPSAYDLDDGRRIAPSCRDRASTSSAPLRTLLACGPGVAREQAAELRRALL
jgi:hypothetical protein